MLSAFHTILRSAVSLNLSSVSLLLIPTAGRRPTTPLTCLNKGGKNPSIDKFAFLRWQHEAIAATDVTTQKLLTVSTGTPAAP